MPNTRRISSSRNAAPIDDFATFLFMTKTTPVSAVVSDFTRASSVGFQDLDGVFVRDFFFFSAPTRNQESMHRFNTDVYSATSPLTISSYFLVV